MSQVLTEPKSKPTCAEREAEILAAYFLPYQRRWIDDASRNKLCEKSRRVGLTFAEQFRRVQRLGTQGARYDAYITSRDEGLAKQFVRESMNFAQVFKIAAEDRGEEVLDKKNGVSAQVIRFATGKQLYSLSSNPNATIGRGGDVTIDEYAAHKDQLDMYRLSKPLTTWGGQWSAFSTHRSRVAYFNQLVLEVREKNNPKKFSLHRITIEDAVREGLWIKLRSQLPDDDERKSWTDEAFLQSCRDEMPDEESYLREYMCVPEDDALSFLSWELITACSNRLLNQIDWRTLPGPFYVGMDVGRRKDLSVITIYHQVGALLVQCAEIVMDRKSFTFQENMLHGILADRRVANARIDKSGLGMQLAEQAEEKFGTDRVKGVMFTLQSKHVLAQPMKRRFEDRTVQIFDDLKLHADLRSVKTETTAAENVIFTTEAGETDGHADRFWSHALAINAAEEIVNPGIFQRLAALINRGRSDSRSRDRRNRSAC
jgi:phage FluMu gp28-like protein